MVNRFGSRPIIIFGGCLAGSGLVAASFCNTVEQLYFFIGVVGGECSSPVGGGGHHSSVTDDITSCTVET